MISSHFWVSHKLCKSPSDHQIFKERNDENFHIYFPILGNNKLTGDAFSAFIALQSSCSKLKVMAGTTNLLTLVKTGFLSSQCRRPLFIISCLPIKEGYHPSWFNPNIIAGSLFHHTTPSTPVPIVGSRVRSPPWIFKPPLRKTCPPSFDRASDTSCKDLPPLKSENLFCPHKNFIKWIICWIGRKRCAWIGQMGLDYLDCILKCKYRLRISWNAIDI